MNAKDRVADLAKLPIDERREKGTGLMPESRWEKKLDELVESLKKAERNLNEGRPPVREVVAKLMDRCADEDLED